MTRIRISSALILLLFLSCTRMPTAPRAMIRVTGSVTGPSREPLPDTHLTFFPDEPALEDLAFTRTDSTGAYSVQLLSGRYRINVEPEPARGFISREETATVSRERRLDFAFLGFRVTGRVTDPTGALVDSGWVRADLPGQGAAETFLRQGTYSMVLPRGRYSFVATSGQPWSGFSPGVWDSVMIAADTTMDLPLGGFLVSGTVLGPDGNPMENVGVEARFSGNYASAENRTRSDGAYRLYLNRGSYTFWLSAPFTYIIPRVIGPVVIDAATSLDGDFAGAEWAGTIRTSGTNEPVPGLLVLVEMQDDPVHRAAGDVDDAQGDFRFIVERNRRYNLRVRDTEIHRDVALVQGITATADTTFDILLPPPPAP